VPTSKNSRMSCLQEVKHGKQKSNKTCCLNRKNTLLRNMRKLIAKLMIVIQVTICSVMLLNQANAEEEANAVLQEGSKYEESIRGLVINQTITPQGREFYRAFVNAWSNQSGSTRYNVVVYERPAGRGANKVWVEYRNRKLYSTFVRMSKQSVLEGMGTYAAQAVRQGITAIQAEEMLNSRDMATEEF